MAKIAKPLRWIKKKHYAIVFVQLVDGSEAEVYVGGEVENYYHHGRNKAYVLKGRPILDKLNHSK